MFYDKKIKYLDYYEGGRRASGCGYVKLEARNGGLRLEMSVTGLRPTDSFERDVLFCAGGHEKTVGKIAFTEGRGCWRKQWNQLENIGGSGICYEDLQGITVSLGGGREITCSLQDGRGGVREGNRTVSKVSREDSGTERRPVPEKRMPERHVPERQEAPAVRTEPPEPESVGEGRAESLGAVPERHVPERQEAPAVRTEPPEPAPEKRMPERTVSPGAVWEKRMPDWGSSQKRDVRKAGNGGGQEGTVRREGAEMKAAESEKLINGRETQKADSRRIHGNNRRHVRLMEDKWAQLWEIYPHIKPFQDEREYISIGPADFVIFPEESYRMVNNSFLLHGFYNYEHLLLARVERKGEFFYYIGVPGNFFEKEKQVAIMFGFESFECAEEPAQAGDFGYYMMRTGL